MSVDPGDEKYRQQDTLSGSVRVGQTPMSSDDPNTRARMESSLNETLDDIDDSEWEDTDDVEEPGDEDEATEDGDITDDEADDADEDESVEEGDSGDDEDESEPEGTVEDETPSTFPAAWRRSLKARQWADNEIDDFWTSNPEIAARVFEQIHKSRNTELAAYADLGRKSRDDGPQLTPATNKADKVTEKSGVLKPLDTDALIQEHGNEDFVRALVEPVNQVIAQINAAMPRIELQAQRAKANEQETLRKTVDSFFDRDDVKAYADFIGDSVDNLTDEQLANRSKVLEQADAIMAGALLQGRELSVPQALEMGFDLATAGQKAQAIRAEIKRSVKQRSRGLTLKPSKRRKRSDSRPTSRTALERKVSNKLAEIYGMGE